MTLQISDRVRTLAAQAEVEIKEQFAHIDAVAEHNTQRVLAAFQSNRVAESYFAGTTGYGYDDLGRDKLDQIYAELFGTEDALVRIGFVNGTHAIAAALFRMVKAVSRNRSLLVEYGALMGSLATICEKGSEEDLSLLRIFASSLAKSVCKHR